MGGAVSRWRALHLETCSTSWTEPCRGRADGPCPQQQQASSAPRSLLNYSTYPYLDCEVCLHSCLHSLYPNKDMCAIWREALLEDPQLCDQVRVIPSIPSEARLGTRSIEIFGRWWWQTQLLRLVCSTASLAGQTPLLAAWGRGSLVTLCTISCPYTYGTPYPCLH